MVLMRSSLGILSVFGKMRALLYATVKGMENRPGGRGFMASQGCWRPRLLDDHKLPNQATHVTDPVACLLDTFPNTYSWHEIEMYGLPAMIDHIIKQTE